MTSNPIQGPGERPDRIEGPGKGAEQPQVGQGQENQKSFSMPEGSRAESAPSPMEVAGQQSVPKMEPQEMQGHIARVQQSLEEAHTKLSDPAVQNQLTDEHYKALSQVSTKLNGDLRTMAENSGGKFEPPIGDPKKSAAQNILNWVNGSQKTLTGALNYLSETKKPNPASYMKMQYAVQRATQRAELFSSIVSSSVSGIKTLMSTQLG
ncbi:MAG: hypothetical protein S4CHLAM81_14800 [Chlamydiales bacterium]|nr:hypothetical protein [Chlamydiales bacterium]MCH9636249.1 hypothetical protein [Chlamydiales bacterium]MCH9703301.1 hypothetical protein [Chlamydiota bacterium]